LENALRLEQEGKRLSPDTRSPALLISCEIEIEGA